MEFAPHPPKSESLFMSWGSLRWIDLLLSHCLWAVAKWMDRHILVDGCGCGWAKWTKGSRLVSSRLETCHVAIKIENKRQQLRCQQNKSAAAISLFDSKRDKLFRPALGPDGRPFFYSVAKKSWNCYLCYFSQHVRLHTQLAASSSVILLIELQKV